MSTKFDRATVKPTSSVFMFLYTMPIFIMAPAIAMFYRGMLRKQNMISMMARCIDVMAVVRSFGES